MTQVKDYNIQPFPGHVLVAPYKEKQVGNYVLQDNINDKDSAGIIVAIGDDYTYYEGNQAIPVPCPVKVGDVIIYQNMGTDAYMEFEGGERLRLVRFHCDPLYSQIKALIKKPYGK